MQLNFHQLHLFCTVARLGSISRAAEELRISQPSVSAQVREFEQRCGLDLLHRLPRGVTLTDVGRLVGEYAENIFDQADELQRLIQNLRGAKIGKLTVGGSLTAGEHFLPQVVRDFRDCHHEVELAIVLANSGDILAQIRGGQLDLGFVGTDAACTELVSIPCWTDEVVIVASPLSLPNCLGTAAELLQTKDFVMREPGSATRDCVEHYLRGRGLEARTAMIVSSPEALKRHVAAGVGWGFASKCSITHEVAADHLAIVGIVDWECKRTFSAVHRKSFQLSPAQQKFVAIAQSLAAR